MEKHPRLSGISAANGNFCAVIDGSYLNVYDVIKNKLLYNVKATCSEFKTKALKLSPSNGDVAWLQTLPDELLIIHVHERRTSRFGGHADFPPVGVIWSPDGKTLAAFSNLSVFIDVYAVGQGHATHAASVSGAKEDEFGCPLAQFSPDGEYFATVNVSSRGYSISIYSCEDYSWDCIQTIVCKESHNVGGLLWCADSASLLVWEAGPTLQLRLWAADGTVERSLAADDAAVCCVCLSDCGRVAAVLTADLKVRILDLLTWRLDMTEVFVHHPIIHISSARCRLKEKVDASTQVSNCEPIRETLYELYQDNALPRKWRSLAQFSVDGQYLATYVASHPRTLWVWRLVADSPLDTVIQLRGDTNVADILWHKEEAVLAANLSCGRVLVWTPAETVIVNHVENPWPFSAQQYLASLILAK